MKGGRAKLTDAATSAIKLAQVVRGRWDLRSCDHVGRWSRAMFGRLVVENHGTIEIGARVRFMSEFAPVELRTGKDGRLTIGDRTGINYGTAIHAMDSVTIGRNVDMGPHCLIIDTVPEGTG